jgi:hypothetical protein
LIERVKGMQLTAGKTYHYEWPDRGYAVIAPTREGYGKHVVKTVLAPRMKPPGEKVAMFNAFFSELEKLGKASVNRLRSVLQGGTPLFHMVNPANAENFIASGGRAMTSGEAGARGLVNSVEGGMGMLRGNAGRKVEGLELLPHGGAQLPTTPMVSEGLIPTGRARALAEMGQEGPVGAYQTAMLTSRVGGPSKNWSNISFTEGAPHRGYGDVGLLTSPNRVKGNLYGVNSMITGAEVQAAPAAVRADGGYASHLALPTATGAMVYDPRKVDRATALRLKEQGAMPLNARTMRKMKYVQREGGLSREKIRTNEWLESGNRRAHGPEFEAAKENATKHLRAQGVPLTFDEQDAADALKRLREPKPPPRAVVETPSVPVRTPEAPPPIPQQTPLPQTLPPPTPRQAPPPPTPRQAPPPAPVPEAAPASPPLPQTPPPQSSAPGVPPPQPAQAAPKAAPPQSAPSNPVRPTSSPRWGTPAAFGALGLGGIALAANSGGNAPANQPSPRRERA